MSDNPVQEVISDLFQYLEALETRCAALVQLLKDKGLATNEDFARCMEQASEASSIKWRAARLRMEHLFATIPASSDKAHEAGKERAETKPEDESKKPSDKGVEQGRAEAKAVESSGKQSAEQPEERKASEREGGRFCRTGTALSIARECYRSIIADSRDSCGRDAREEERER